MKTTCAWCGAEIDRPPYRAKHRSFCDRACKGKYRSTHLVGENAAHWKGGSTKSHGRKLVYAPGHPHAKDGRYVYEHRLVIEQSIGRRLSESEVVHHLDGDIENNAPENLAILPSQSVHARQFHGAAGRWSRDHEQCVACGRTDSAHAARGKCRRCYSHDYELTYERHRGAAR